MEENVCAVIASMSGVIVNTWVFLGEDRDKVGKEAEEKFVRMIKKEFSSNTDGGYIEQYLDEGYAEYGKWEFSLIWPNIVRIKGDEDNGDKT